MRSSVWQLMVSAVCLLLILASSPPQVLADAIDLGYPASSNLDTLRTGASHEEISFMQNLEYSAVASLTGTGSFEETADVAPAPMLTPLGKSLLCVMSLSIILLSLRLLRRRRELLTTQQYLDALLENMPALFSLKDLNGRFLRTNSRYDRFWRLPHNGLTGRNIADLFREPDLRNMREAAEETLQAGQPRRFERQIQVDDRNYVLDVTTFLVYDQQQRPSACAALLRDVTEQKDCEAVLRMLDLNERSLGEILRAFAHNVDIDKNLDFVLGLLMERHRLLAAAIYLHDADTNVLRRRGTHAAGRELPYTVPRQAQSQNEILQKAGVSAWQALRPTSVVAWTIPQSDSKPGVLLIASDHEFNHVEQHFFEQLAEYLALLIPGAAQRHELRSALHQLEEEHARLEHDYRAKTEWLASMSHELRAPLHAIMGFSELLKEGMQGVLSRPQQSSVRDIFDGAEHLLGLIDDLLDLTKIDAGKMRLEKLSTDLHALAANALAIVRTKAEERDLQLHVDVDPALGHALLDARRIRQILYNLLSNAVKFTGDGGRIDLRMRCHPSADLPPAVAPIGHPLCLELTVCDTGIGIPQQQIEQLFKPFSQLTNQLAHSLPGTGLGLALVKNLAQLHGGNVSVQSEVGRGSCFSVWLPLETAKVQQQPSNILRASPRALPTGLLLEGHADIGRRLKTQLTAAGLSIATSTSLQAAVALTGGHGAPDLIALDIATSLNWILQDKHQRLPRAPLLLLDTCSEPGRALGVVRLLVQPLHPTQLLEALIASGLTSQTAERILLVDDSTSAADIAEKLRNLGHVVAQVGRDRAIIAAESFEPALIVADLASGFDLVHALRNVPALASVPVFGVIDTMQANSACCSERNAIDQASLEREIARLLALRAPTL